MSIAVINHVWQYSTQKGAALLVLLAIADFADDKGLAYPSIKTLATKARVSERGVQYVLRQIVAAGELLIEPNAGPHGCNLFRVQRIHPVQSLQGANGDQKSPRGVQPAAPGGAKALHPNHQEPSEREPSNPPNHLAGAFVSVWKNYPNRIGRRAAERSFNKSVTTARDLSDIQSALENYVQRRNFDNAKRKEHGLAAIPWQNGSTWFNNWRDWIPGEEERIVHEIHRCPYCPNPHDWKCKDPSDCPFDVVAACPDYIASRRKAANG